MRYLLLICIGFAAGCAGFIWLLQGSGVYIGMAVLFLLGMVCLLLRRRKLWRGLCCILIAAAVGIGYCQLYTSFYLQPMQRAVQSERDYHAEVCREPELLSSDWYSIEVRLRIEGRSTRAVLYTREQVDCAIGDILQFSGTLEWAETTEGESLYYPARGIRLTGTLPDGVVCVPAYKISLRNLPLLFSAKARQMIMQLFDGDAAGLLCALITGDRALLSAALREKLSVTGIYHMVAVSGMHVSILIGIVQVFCRRRRTLTAVVGIPILAFFALMTGAAAGTVRAALMLSVLLIAPLLKRENDSPTTLGFAALLILLSNPYELASVSFQLTFCATAGILLLSGRLFSFFVPKRKKTKNKILNALFALWRTMASILSVTLSAQLATLLLNMWYFGQVSVISPLTNLLTSFAVTLMFALGIWAVLFGFIFLPLAMPFCLVCTILSDYVFSVVRLLSRTPFAAIYTISPYAIFFVLFLYTVAIILLIRKEKPRLVISACCIVIMLCICFVMGALQLRLPAFSFAMLDVGQGQCLLASSEGKTLMIDCGGDTDAIAARAAVAQLSTMGTRKLDVLVLTHYDADHAGGAALLLELVDVGMILAPDTWDDYGIREEVQFAAEKSGTTFVPIGTQTMEFALGEGHATVYPPVAYTSDNETSVSVLCSFDRYDILVTGDMSQASEQILLKLYDLPDIETFVAGHHGSKNSTSAELLAELRPELVLISVGENNYGHPAEETINRILTSGAVIQRTDEEGNIIIRR